MRIRKGHSINGIAYRDNLFRAGGRCPGGDVLLFCGAITAPTRLESIEGLGEEDSWLW